MIKQIQKGPQHSCLLQGHGKALQWRTRAKARSGIPWHSIYTNWFWNAEPFNRMGWKIFRLLYFLEKEDLKPIESKREEQLWIIWWRWAVSRGSQCDVCCADTIFFNTEHKCHRSWGSRDSFTLTYSILSPLISYSSRLYPTIGYLTTEKKLKSSDTTHCKAFNPVQGLLRVFFGGLNLSVKEQVNIMTPALGLWITRTTS